MFSKYRDALSQIFTLVSDPTTPMLPIHSSMVDSVKQDLQ